MCNLCEIVLYKTFHVNTPKVLKLYINLHGNFHSEIELDLSLLKLNLKKLKSVIEFAIFLLSLKSANFQIAIFEF
jgi:hypothetical protein